MTISQLQSCSSLKIWSPNQTFLTLYQLCSDHINHQTILSNDSPILLKKKTSIDPSLISGNCLQLSVVDSKTLGWFLFQRLYPITSYCPFFHYTYGDKCSQPKLSRQDNVFNPRTSISFRYRKPNIPENGQIHNFCLESPRDLILVSISRFWDMENSTGPLSDPSD